jgi:hypothetical protein
VLVAAPILGAFYLRIANASSPFFCPLKSLTGVPCPGCGLTRSFVAIASGKIPEAIAFNLFGIFLFVGLLIALLHLSLEITFRKKILAVYTEFITNRSLHVLMLLVVMLWHCNRLYQLSLSGSLAIAFRNSPVGQLFY